MNQIDGQPGNSTMADVRRKRPYTFYGIVVGLTALTLTTLWILLDSNLSLAENLAINEPALDGGDPENLSQIEVSVDSVVNPHISLLQFPNELSVSGFEDISAPVVTTDDATITGHEFSLGEEVKYGWLEGSSINYVLRLSATPAVTRSLEAITASPTIIQLTIPQRGLKPLQLEFETGTLVTTQVSTTTLKTTLGAHLSQTKPQLTLIWASEPDPKTNMMTLYVIPASYRPSVDDLLEAGFIVAPENAVALRPEITVAIPPSGIKLVANGSILEIEAVVSIESQSPIAIDPSRIFMEVGTQQNKLIPITDLTESISQSATYPQSANTYAPGVEHRFILYFARPFATNNPPILHILDKEFLITLDGNATGK